MAPREAPDRRRRGPAAGRRPKHSGKRMVGPPPVGVKRVHIPARAVGAVRFDKDGWLRHCVLVRTTRHSSGRTNGGGALQRMCRGRRTNRGTRRTHIRERRVDRGPPRRAVDRPGRAHRQGAAALRVPLGADAGGSGVARADPPRRGGRGGARRPARARLRRVLGRAGAARALLPAAPDPKPPRRARHVRSLSERPEPPPPVGRRRQSAYRGPGRRGRPHPE
jgi:hypothetical protein